MRPLVQKRHGFSVASIDDGDLFTSSHVTVLDENSGSPITAMHQQLHRATCGHVLTDPSQIVTCSIGGEVVCPACQVRCGGFCNRIICNAHAKRLDGKLYCSRCRVALVVPKVFRGLHRLLSKEM